MRTILTRCCGTLCATATLLTLALDAVGADADWTYWRGPQMNGISTEKNLPDEWDPAGGEGSNVLWKRDIGSRSTPVYMDGRLYMICNNHPEEAEREGERVVCLDGATGETVWEYGFNVYLSDVPRERIGWASVVAAPDPADPSKSRIFALGVCGYFCCLNAHTGAVEWDKSLHEEYGFLSTYGGRTNFPIVHENNVIVSAVVIGWGEQAKPTHRFLALDQRNGEPVWYSGTRVFPEDTTYSAPVLCTLGGKAAIVFGSGDGALHAMEPRTGRIIWSYYCSKHGLNCAPLVANDTVYLGHSEENLGSNTMGAMICLDGTQSGDISKNPPKWRIDELGVGRSSPMLVDGRLYVIDDQAKMFILNPETGEQIGKQALGTFMRSSPLYVDGKFYLGTADGRYYVLKPSEKGVDIVKRGRLARGEECHGSAIAARGRIYFPTTDAMYCIGKPDAQPEAETPPNPLAGEAPKDDETPAVVQITPVEALLMTDPTKGDAQSFDVRLYNDKGQFLRMAKPEEVEFTIDGPGTIARNPDDANRWRYAVGPEQSQQAAVIVTAKLGEVAGSARIRVIPELDWSYNFDDGVVPVTWVGIRYRHVVVDFDLYQKLTAANPLAGQLYIFVLSNFVNTGAPKQVLDNSTTQQRWTGMMDYLQRDLADTARNNLEQAQTLLNESLELLKTEGVIASYEWTPAPALQLTLAKGPRKVDGNGVLCKITTIPKGMRSQGWMGPIHFRNYTIQADVMGFRKNGKLPDIGLIAQRYTVDLMGASQQVQLRSWVTQLERFSVNQPLTWEPETWYTLKLQASVEGDKAVLRTKVWPKGEAEPAEWTAVGEDHLPNVMGSPGLFGNSKDSELFYDNLTVKRNETAAAPAAAGAQ
ncbi:MAG: PQQ-like beta-propeller repeat protein [Planctomycetaceae bacterium]|nr:PQQ-like beta-propeller repeat protein [Planctomycetaceae bacterium]